MSSLDRMLSEESLQERYEDYAMLSRLFRLEIDAPLLKDLIDSPVPEPSGNEAIDASFAEMRAYLDEANDRTKSNLAIDYVITFIGYPPDPNDKNRPKGPRAAVPYESVYVSRNGALLQESTLDVTAIYNAYGFRPTKTRIEFDDHIACELEFLQFLTGQAILAMREGERTKAEGCLREQMDFIDAHMLTWVPKFSELAQQFSETALYRALAKLALAVVEADRERISQALEQ